MTQHHGWCFDLPNDNWDSVDNKQHRIVFHTCLNECPFLCHDELVVAKIVEINS